jgi:type VI secretion system protein ImpA
MPTVDIDSLLSEIAPDAPCGPNLEYDPAFLELEQAVQGKDEVQYGDTITPAVPPEWKVVRRLASSLLERSRDLRVAVLLLRASLALDGFAGMADCIHLIERLLEERWDSVHPQLDADDDLDPTLRINSLAILSDAATVLREVKEATVIVLPGLGPISVRSLEIATGELAASDGQAKFTMSSIEAALKDVEQERLLQTLQIVTDSFERARKIETLLVQHVGSSQALNLDPLTRMLARARDVLATAVVVEEAEPAEQAESGQGDAGTDAAKVAKSGGAISGEINSREDVVRMLDKIASYYKREEPSSPVPLLLERARRAVTMNFMELLQELAPDGVQHFTAVSGARPEET